MDDFNKVAEELLKQKQALQAKYDQARASAISHVQQIIKDFKIKESDLIFESSTPKKTYTRGPASIKYKLPSGVTWTGQGRMKKEFKEYKDLHFRQLSDKEFLAKFALDNPIPVKESEEKKSK